MKRIALFVVLCFCATTFAQTPEFYSGKDTYNKQLQSSKDEIWTAIKIWVATEYKYPDKAIVMEDRDSGILILKTVFPELEASIESISYMPSLTLQFTVSDSLCTLKILNGICTVDLSSKAREVLVYGGSYSYLTKIQNQIEALQSVCTESFGSSMEWNVINGGKEISQKYKAQMESAKKKRDKESATLKYTITQEALASYIAPTPDYIKDVVSMLDSI